MPKTNDNTGATAAGQTGIVEHGAPVRDGRTLSELDPERNLDGSLVEGEHPDHADGEEREVSGTTEVTPLEADDEDVRPINEPAEDERPAHGEEESSLGTSSATSPKKTASYGGKSSSKAR